MDAAMREYSEYALQALLAETQTGASDLPSLMLEFSDRGSVMTAGEVKEALVAAGVQQSNVQKVTRFLLEANFLGLAVDEHNYRFARSPAEAETMYRQAARFAERSGGQRNFRIHRAFHTALALTA